MHIKPFRATYPVLARISSPDTFCSEAKYAFRDYVRDNLLAETGKPALFVYQIDDRHRRHTGLVALNDVEDFFAGKVKKHEKTLSEREEHHKELLLRWGASLKPVLLTFPPVAELNAWLANFTQDKLPFLEIDFQNDHQRHRVWMASDEDDIRTVQRLFEQHVLRVYIADGHHRTSTMARLHRQFKHEYPLLDFDHLLCAYFATDQLDILDYNRVIDGLNDLSPQQLFGRLGKVFNIEYIEHPRKPRSKYQLKLFFRENWYRLDWKPEVLANHKPSGRDLPVLLDVSLLNELVLHDILGIGDVRTDARISYVEGAKGLQGIRKAVRKHPDRIGFALYPVAFDDMMRIADAGMILPPKSTYFEPRMKTGILVKRLAKP